MHRLSRLVVFDMSVLDVFGRNLRLLTALRGSQASVANDLGLSRVQFQRFLRSESFPKPNVLKHICDYFGADARILTDPISEDQLKLIRSGRYRAVVPRPATVAMHEALEYCAEDQDYFKPSDDLPDGIYQGWRGSFSRPNMVVSQLVQFKTRGGARVVNGFEPLVRFSKGIAVSGRAREFRGILMRPMDGYVVLYMHSEPSRYVSIEYMKPIDINYQPAAVGFFCIARASTFGMQRITRSLTIKVGNDWRSAMAAMRQSGLYRWDQIPDHVRVHIEPMGECF